MTLQECCRRFSVVAHRHVQPPPALSQPGPCRRNSAQTSCPAACRRPSYSIRLQSGQQLDTTDDMLTPAQSAAPPPPPQQPAAPPQQGRASFSAPGGQVFSPPSGTRAPYLPPSAPQQPPPSPPASAPSGQARPTFQLSLVQQEATCLLSRCLWHTAAGSLTPEQ